MIMSSVLFLVYVKKTGLRLTVSEKFETDGLLFEF